MDADLRITTLHALMERSREMREDMDRNEAVDPRDYDQVFYLLWYFV
jgi:hypothetical protein